MSVQKVSENLEKIALTLASIDHQLKNPKRGFAYYIKYLHLFYAIVIIAMLFFADQDHINVSELIQDSATMLNMAQN